MVKTTPEGLNIFNAPFIFIVSLLDRICLMEYMYQNEKNANGVI